MPASVEVTIEVDDLTLTLPEEVFQELHFIIQNGHVFQNTMRPPGVDVILFEHKLITTIVVTKYRKKVAATELGGRVCLAYEDARAAMKIAHTTNTYLPSGTSDQELSEANKQTQSAQTSGL